MIKQRCEKKPYKTEAAARYALDRLRRVPGRAESSVHRCGKHVSETWHLTSTPQNHKRKTRRRKW